MPRLIPESPTFTTGSEKEVWERLRDTLADDDVLLANLRLTDGDKDHEADLVVLMPDVGVLVLEVKGGSVTVEPDDAEGHRWWTQSGGGRRQIRPVDQARGTKHALRRYVDQHPRGGTSAPGGVGTRRGRALHAVRRGLQRPRAAALVAPRQGRPGRCWRSGSATRAWWMQHGDRRRPTTTSRCSPTS